MTIGIRFLFVLGLLVCAGCETKQQTWQEQFADTGFVAGTGLKPDRTFAIDDVPVPEGAALLESSGVSRHQTANGHSSGSATLHQEYKIVAKVGDFVAYFRDLSAKRGWKETRDTISGDLRELQFTRVDDKMTLKINTSDGGSLHVTGDCVFNWRNVKQSEK